MKPKPLRRKLALAYMGLIAAVLACAGWILVGHVSNVFMDSIASDLTVRAGLTSELVSTAWPWPDADAGDRLAAGLAVIAEARVTVVGADGVVLAESSQPSAYMVNHADRPEIMAALAGTVGVSRRYSETTAERMLYVALPRPPAGPLPAVVRLAVSLEWVWARTNIIRMSLLAVLGGGLAVSVLLGLWLGRRMLTAPLRHIVDGAGRFVAGDLTSRINVETGDDWEVLAQSLNDMAGSLDSQIRQIEAERNRIRSTIESLPDGVLLISAAGHLLLSNRLARTWLSLPGTGGATASASGAITQLGRTPELRTFVLEALADSGGRTLEMTLRSPSQSRLEVRSAWLGAAGASDLLVVLHDITEIRRLEAVRRDFVANVSHDLKTPIGAIQVLAETLARDRGDDPATTVDFLGRIVAETQRLTRLVEEMLQLSRLESGVEGLNLTEADLSEIAARAIEATGPLAEAKGIVILQHHGNDTALRCDRAKVERAIASLLDNAIKFSPGGTTVTVRTEGQLNQVELSVEDHGPGIEAEELPRVFERFYKVEQSRRGPGSGLGLAIVKHVVSSHGGQVYARSTLAHGSVFGFSLPRRLP